MNEASLQQVPLKRIGSSLLERSIVSSSISMRERIQNARTM